MAEVGWLDGAMHKPSRRQATLARDLDVFTGDLCRDSGYCGLLGSDFLGRGGVVSADAFARWVIEASGLDPDTSADVGVIRRRFIERYGSSDISAQTYRP